MLYRRFKQNSRTLFIQINQGSEDRPLSVQKCPMLFEQRCVLFLELFEESNNRAKPHRQPGHVGFAKLSDSIGD